MPPISLDTNTHTVAGGCTIGAGKPRIGPLRPGGEAIPSKVVSTTGKLVLAEDNETVLFVPDDAFEFAAVVAKDETEGQPA